MSTLPNYDDSFASVYPPTSLRRHLVIPLSCHFIRIFRVIVNLFEEATHTLHKGIPFKFWTKIANLKINMHSRKIVFAPTLEIAQIFLYREILFKFVSQLPHLILSFIPIKKLLYKISISPDIYLSWTLNVPNFRKIKETFLSGAREVAHNYRRIFFTRKLCVKLFLLNFN